MQQASSSWVFGTICRTMLYVARAIRWRRITVKDDRYFEFREWLLLEERRKLIGKMLGAFNLPSLIFAP